MTSDGVCHRSFEVVQSSGLENAASSNQSILQIFFYFFFLLLWKGGSNQAGDCSHMNSKLKQTGKCSSVSVKWM